jgi:hypothetical protein
MMISSIGEMDLLTESLLLVLVVPLPVREEATVFLARSNYLAQFNSSGENIHATRVCHCLKYYSHYHIPCSY